MNIIFSSMYNNRESKIYEECLKEAEIFRLERDKIVSLSYLRGCYVEVKHFKYLQKTDLRSFFFLKNKVVDFILE